MRNIFNRYVYIFVQFGRSSRILEAKKYARVFTRLNKCRMRHLHVLHVSFPPHFRRIQKFLTFSFFCVFHQSVDITRIVMTKVFGIKVLHVM